DGIYSPGIHALAEVAKQFGEVRVVAPDVEQSLMGHATTANRPLNYRLVPVLKEFSGSRVNGTRADCVALGVSQWNQKVDFTAKRQKEPHRRTSALGLVGKVWS